MRPAPTISKPRPLFRRMLTQAPAHPLGARVLLREFPVESKSEGGLVKPDVAKAHYFGGEIVAAGDQAADALRDLGVEIGDEVWFAQYAGILQEWQHIVGLDDMKCLHTGVWDYVATTDGRWNAVGEPNENLQLRECRNCGTLKVTERMICIAVADICLDVDLQERLESGKMRRVRAQTADGKTRYLIERPGQAFGATDCFETEATHTDEEKEAA